MTERLTTEHEVGGSNHRQTDVLKSEEKNWKKLKSVSYVVCCLGRLMEDRCSNEDELDMSFSVDSCVRKHARVYGENRQPCFNVRIKISMLLGSDESYRDVTETHQMYASANNSNPVVQ